MDKRDDQTWVVLELTRFGETKVDDGTLEATIRRDLDVTGDHPIFIPVLSYPKGNRTITIHLMEGYAFVGSGLPDTSYFSLERHSYVDKIISTPGRPRTLNVVPDAKIEELRTKLRQMVSADIQDGATVRVTNGTYRNLEGITIVVTSEAAIVRIKLRSLDLIATIPTAFLEAILNPEGQDDEQTPVADVTVPKFSRKPVALRDEVTVRDREFDDLVDLILMEP